MKKEEKVSGSDYRGFTVYRRGNSINFDSSFTADVKDGVLIVYGSGGVLRHAFSPEQWLTVGTAPPKDR